MLGLLGSKLGQHPWPEQDPPQKKRETVERRYFRRSCLLLWVAWLYRYRSAAMISAISPLTATQTELARIGIHA